MEEKFKIKKLFFIVACLFSIAVNAQLRQFPDTIRKSKLNSIIITESATYLSGLAFLQYIWYHDKARVPFHYYDDSKGWMQLDKFGHALTAYKESYYGYYGLRRAGVSKTKSLLWGGPLGFFLQAPIEVFDGMYEGWGFSWSDMIANTAGSVLLIGQELIFNDQPIKLKMSFRRSEAAKLKPWYLGYNQFESFFYDYNGHTYWLSINMNKIVPWDRIPNWLNFSFGYSADNMFSEFENTGVYAQYKRHRQYLFSLDVDWTKIKTKNKFLKALFGSMLVVKFPFPAIEWNAQKGVVGHWLYY